MKSGLVLVVSLSLLAAAGQEKEHDLSAEALTTRFRRSCMTCHQPPDLRFEVDRAWLKQVHDTA